MTFKIGSKVVVANTHTNQREAEHNVVGVVVGFDENLVLVRHPYDGVMVERFYSAERLLPVTGSGNWNAEQITENTHYIYDAAGSIVAIITVENAADVAVVLAVLERGLKGSQ